MKREPETTRNNSPMAPPSLITSVIQKPQRKSMSKYMIKKQVSNIDKILNDPQIMG
jgi:hypothetical protein